MELVTQIQKVATHLGLISDQRTRDNSPIEEDGTNDKTDFLKIENEYSREDLMKKQVPELIKILSDLIDDMINGNTKIGNIGRS